MLNLDMVEPEAQADLLAVEQPEPVLDLVDFALIVVDHFEPDVAAAEHRDLDDAPQLFAAEYLVVLALALVLVQVAVELGI